MAVKAKKPSAADKLAAKKAQYDAIMAAQRSQAEPLGFSAPPDDDDPPPSNLSAEAPVDDVEILARPSGKGEDFAIQSKSPAAPSRPARPNPFDDIGLCFVCKATSCGSGVAPGWNTAPKFYCTECGPKLAKAHYNVRNGKLNAVEIAAADEAGAEIGAYLDGLGQTDLAKLSQLEFSNFCRRFIAAYIKKARETARYNMPD